MAEGADTTGIMADQPPAPPFAMPGPSKTAQRPTSLAVESQIAAASAFPRLPIPPITESNIDGYFYSIDFWFRASGITDDNRKFNTVLGQVPPQKLIDLRAIIEKAPASSKYDYIKDELTKHYSDSQQRRLRKVLSDMPLGDMKPSQLFNSMSRVADGALTESALLELSQTRLPTHTHAAIAASEGSTESKLRIADVINDSMDFRANSTVNLIREVPKQNDNPIPQPENTTKEIFALVKKLDKFLRARKSSNNDQQ